MVTEIVLGTLTTYGTISGYIYLHVPQYLCKQFNIKPKAKFIALYRDGDLLIKQVKEGV